MIWVDRLALVWAIVLIFAICALQQPDGFEHSLAASNIIGGWGSLILWFVLRVIDAMFVRHRY